MSSSNDIYNRGGLIAFIFSVVFSFSFIFYISFLHPGVNLKEIPQEAPAGEGLAGGGAGGVPANFDAAKVEKPWVASPELVAYGRQVYSTNCALCHGAEGKGDGAAGVALNPKPRNLIKGPWKQGGGIVNHYKTLITGIPGGSMASFKHLPKVDRWALVHFIESFTEAKTVVSPAEVEEYAKNAE